MGILCRYFFFENFHKKGNFSHTIQCMIALEARGIQKITLLFLDENICCGYSLEASQ